MFASSPGTARPLREDSPRPPADALCVDVVGRVLGVSWPHHPWTTSDGGPVGGAIFFPLQTILEAEELVAGLRCVGMLPDGGTLAWSEAQGFVRVDAPNEPLDLALPEPPPRPSPAGALLAERLVQALSWMPDAGAHLRYALRRATALDRSHREATLVGLHSTLCELLPGAYAGTLVDDDFVEAVEDRFAQPLLSELQVHAPDLLEDVGEPLHEALVNGTLSDLGECFMAQVEVALAQLIQVVLELLDLRDATHPPQHEAARALVRLEAAIDALPQSWHPLLDSCVSTDTRDTRARDILEPLGYGWLLD